MGSAPNHDYAVGNAGLASSSPYYSVGNMRRNSPSTSRAVAPAPEYAIGNMPSAGPTYAIGNMPSAGPTYAIGNMNQPIYESGDNSSTAFPAYAVGNMNQQKDLYATAKPFTLQPTSSTDHLFSNTDSSTGRPSKTGSDFAPAPDEEYAEPDSVDEPRKSVTNAYIEVSEQ